jgi:hypothetical protein
MSALDRRASIYAEALSDQWKANPSNETHHRYRNFIDTKYSARLVWLDWVEERAKAGSPQWCVDLVLQATTNQLFR